ncbi:hypothetical protein [Pseudomonas sp. TMP9]|uniref:hypothetical protein n=1 Tax=Pseudomonas sp. TMP9 TaxID=3133144 RepID=UPI0030CDA6FC
MNQPYSDVYRYIVKELTPTAHKPDEVSLSIVCEPVNAPGHQSTVTLHLEPGTTMAEAQEIADTLQSKVKGLFHTQVKKNDRG